jgi:alkaline phosphatase D
VLPKNPFVKFLNNRRGYVRCEVRPNTMQADFRVVEYVSRPGAPVRTAAAFLVTSGRAGAERI